MSKNKKITLFGIILIVAFIGQPYRFAYSTTKSLNHNFFLYKKISASDDFKVGDYIVFIPPIKGHYSDSLYKNRMFIKIVIGIGGDRVSVNNKKTMINGRVTITNLPKNSQKTSYIISPNHYYVSGESENSIDSRHFGTVNKIHVFYKAFPIF